MSRTDFETSTVAEFEAICKSWSELRDDDFKSSWERVRTLAAITIQPHLAKGHRLPPTKLLPFPWDAKAEPRPKAQKGKPSTTERFKELTEKLG